MLVVFLIFFSFHLYVLLYASVVAFSIYSWEPQAYNFSNTEYKEVVVDEVYNGNELVTDKELATAKAKYAGNFVLSLEDPKTIAQFALNIKTQKLNPEFYINYLKNINAVTKEDVIRVSKKYFLSDQSRIVVTGKGSEILENIEKLNLPLEVH